MCCKHVMLAAKKQSSYISQKREKKKDHNFTSSAVITFQRLSIHSSCRMYSPKIINFVCKTYPLDERLQIKTKTHEI